MTFIRVGTNETARKVLHELKVIPNKLLNITNEFGIHTYCFNKQVYPSWIGLLDDYNTNDGRSLDETSFFNPNDKSICIFDWDLCEDEYTFSTIIHEYAHALDFALGSKIKANTYLSDIHPDILKGWEKQKGLDWYANLNTKEYFAQAFMAFIFSDTGTYKPWSYREHTQQELKEKDSNMFYLINNIMKEI